MSVHCSQYFTICYAYSLPLYRYFEALYLETSVSHRKSPLGMRLRRSVVFVDTPLLYSRFGNCPVTVSLDRVSVTRNVFSQNTQQLTMQNADLLESTQSNTRPSLLTGLAGNKMY